MTIGFSRLIPALVLFGSLPLSGAVDLDFEKENHSHPIGKEKS